MKRLLIIAISCLALTACLKEFRKDTPEQRQISANKPNGRGDPSAISCYRPPSSTNRFSELECRRNSEWAQIAVDDNHAVPTNIADRAEGVPVNVVHH